MVDGTFAPVYTLLVLTEEILVTNGPPTVMVCVQVLKFPAASVAFHVRVVVLPLNASVYVMAIVPPQLSVAVAVPALAGVAGNPQASVTLAGQVITGACVSFTVTVKLHTTVPHTLLAVMVTVVVPLLNVLPLPFPVPLPVVAPLNVYVHATGAVPAAAEV